MTDAASFCCLMPNPFFIILTEGRRERTLLSLHRLCSSHISVTEVWPAHVAQWFKHLGAMCSRAWRAPWPGFVRQLGRISLPKNFYFWLECWQLSCQFPT